MAQDWLQQIFEYCRFNCILRLEPSHVFNECQFINGVDVMKRNTKVSVGVDYARSLIEFLNCFNIVLEPLSSNFLRNSSNELIECLAR